MTTIENQPKLLKELSDSLSQAEGSASQLIHSMQDPRWIFIREALDLTKEGVMKLATFEASKSLAIGMH